IDKLQEILRDLFRSDRELDTMKADPEKYFGDKGLPEVSPEDVDRCVARMAPTYASSGHMASVSSTSGGGAAAASPAQAAAQQVIAHHQTIVQQYGDFTYIDQSSESYVDNSVNVGDITAHGDVDLDIDNENATATEGGVALGEDAEISGQVNTGELTGVQGNGNTVTDSTFGDGNTSYEQNITAGGDAILGDGNSTTNVTVEGSEDTNIALGDGNHQSADDIDNSINDSYNTDNSVDNSINDSYDTEDSFNTDNSVNDSYNSTDNSIDVDTEVNTDVGLI